MEFHTLQERNRFIELYFPLVVSRVRKINNNKFNEDLFQEGAKALIEATKGFNENKGKFATYSIPIIDCAIIKYKMFDSVIRPYKERNKWKFHYKDTVSFDDEKHIDRETVFSFENEINDKELDQKVIEEFLGQLSGKNKIIFNLLLKGVSHKKISEVIGTHRTYVTKLISREVKRYRENYLDNI